MDGFGKGIIFTVCIAIALFLAFGFGLKADKDSLKSDIKKCGQDRIECYQRFLGMEATND